MSNTISYEDFSKLDIRVGRIFEIKEHPNADKLYVLKVDFGKLGNRTIVAGLKNHYKKEEIINKLGIFIINLQPIVLRGIKSEGMILAAVNENESIIKILEPEKNIEPGSKIR